MVLLIIIPMKNGYFIGNIPNIFRQTHFSFETHGDLGMLPFEETRIIYDFERTTFNEPLKNERGF